MRYDGLSSGATGSPCECPIIRCCNSQPSCCIDTPKSELIMRLQQLSRCVLLSATVLFYLATCASNLAEARPAKPADDEVAASSNDADYWTKRGAEFRHNTTFELSKDNIKLLGGKFSSVRTGNLPSWFDYELFKKVYNKRYANADEELARHHEYIKSCMRTLKQRVLFRILAGTEDAFITSDADLFYEERLPRATSGANSNLPTRDDNEVSIFVIEFEVQELAHAGGSNHENDLHELPVDKAIRLVREELGQTVSKNQLNHYLMAFHEVDGSAIAGKLPY